MPQINQNTDVSRNLFMRMYTYNKWDQELRYILCLNTIYSSLQSNYCTSQPFFLTKEATERQKIVEMEN